MRQRVQSTIRSGDRLTKFELTITHSCLLSRLDELRALARQERESTGCTSASTIMSLMEYESACRKISHQLSTFGKGRIVLVEVPE